MGLGLKNITDQNLETYFDGNGTHSDQPNSTKNDQSRRDLVVLSENPETQPSQWYQTEEDQSSQGGQTGHTEGHGGDLMRIQQQDSQMQADGVHFHQQRYHGEAHIVARQDNKTEAAHHLGEGVKVKRLL